MKVPEIVRMALFSVASNLEVCTLLLQTGAKYSAVEKKGTLVERCSICVAASHVMPAKRCIRVEREVTFAAKFLT